MKAIKYRIRKEYNIGAEEPNIVERFITKITRCTDERLDEFIEQAQREAYNGEYTVEDMEDPVTEPTQLDQIEAQVTYTAMMTDTLLEE